MATLNLGRIKPVFRGAYNNSTAYVVDDIVTSSGETFICILASTGNATSNATYWTKLAEKGLDGTNVATTLTTQGDILYRDASGLQRLGAGTSGQLLKTLGTGANPVWATVAGGAFGQFVYNSDGTDYSNTSQTNFLRATNTKVQITPTSASNDILVIFNFQFRLEKDDSSFEHHIIRDIGGTETNVRDAGGSFMYNYSNDHGTINMYRNATIFVKDSPSTTSQCTYTVEFKNPHRTDAVHLNTGGNISEIMALEIN